MKAEKVIAILVAIFNILTNVLMLIAAVLFFILLMLPGKDLRGILALIVAYSCIIYSFGFNYYFINHWFNKPYNNANLLKLWIAAFVHYFLFILFVFYLHWCDKSEYLFSTRFIYPIYFPLTLSIIGLILNRDSVQFEPEESIPIDKESSSKLESDGKNIIP